MNKKYLSGVITLLLAIVLFNIYINNQDNTQSISLMNIEALADEEGGVSHYWCCGNTGDCVTGPGYSIKGKLSTGPCGQ